MRKRCGVCEQILYCILIHYKQTTMSVIGFNLIMNLKKEKFWFETKPNATMYKSIGTGAEKFKKIDFSKINYLFSFRNVELIFERVKVSAAFFIFAVFHEDAF